MTMKTQPQEIYEMQPKQREVHSDTSLSQETRKITNKEHNLPPKRITQQNLKIG